MKGFVGNIEEMTKGNSNFRKVIFTSPKSQLVLMSIKPGEEIGMESHDGDQFIRIEEGEARVIMGDDEQMVEDDFAIVIPSGTNHNIINTGEENLKLYSVYSPPQHKDMAIHKTKEEADMAEEEEE